MTKKELRKIYKEKRAAIPSKEKLKLDDVLLINFQRLYFEDVAVLLTYWAKTDAQEPNTHLFSGFLRHSIPGLQLAYPKCDLNNYSMEALQVNEDTVYYSNQYGITEPKEGIIIEPAEIDLVFVPLLVCDNNGYRVGYGKGFYDRYLTRCRRDIIKIGFSYFDPVEKIDDKNDFDIPLDYCITPESVYEF
ncbi:5-formyltetrahydrofolate cyclo-ligase [Panacibacter ginsenosidivorans]|uniref:5-formyltetrahydrofolate cyclo-ligase n=1 Tax=Panacibacter ginsenosidivorans TaxID=1813871 RepID=A0A5B8V7L9_9BACT|nr:5-formyltetrahydrofolate cyclo-ligase [Panacibacter ginsenosidivorans]QEC67332.1 5-formyltetrahydrofolate cyclo-ligase [Panacibacter ginsenosidivorans]